MLGKNLQSIRSINAAGSLNRCLSAKAQSKKESSGNSVQVTTLPSGIVLATIDAPSPLSRVAVVVRAGARYEPQKSLGLTHILRSSAGLTTERFTTFGITRNIEYFGGRLSVAGNRDTISYLLEAHNDGQIIEKNLAMLSDTIARPAFKPWELADNLERIRADISIMQDSPQVQLAEAIHRAAFKGGLRNSLFAPTFSVGKHTSEDLQKYVRNRYVAKNTVVVGLGVEHDRLIDLVGQNMTLGASSPSQCQSKYIGGELHIDAFSPYTYVALASEGVGSKNINDVVAVSLLQTILGRGSQIKHSSGLNEASRLGKAISGAAGEGGQVAISSFNFNYENTGLFGINLIAPSDSDVKGLLKSAVKEFKAAASSLSDDEVEKAKKNLKTSLMISLDDPSNLVQEIASQLLFTGQKMSIEELCQAVDSVSASDIKKIAGKMAKGKVALATVGPNAPYLDDISEDESDNGGGCQTSGGDSKSESKKEDSKDKKSEKVEAPKSELKENKLEKKETKKPDKWDKKDSKPKENKLEKHEPVFSDDEFDEKDKFEPKKNKLEKKDTEKSDKKDSEKSDKKESEKSDKKDNEKKK